MIEAKVRSTTQRRRITTKPVAPRGRLTISSATWVFVCAQSASRPA